MAFGLSNQGLTPPLGSGTGLGLLSAFNPASVVAGLALGFTDLVTGGPGQRSAVRESNKVIQLSVDAFNAREAAARRGVPLSIFDTDSRAAETLDQLAAQAGITVDQLLGIGGTFAPSQSGPSALDRGSLGPIGPGLDFQLPAAPSTATFGGGFMPHVPNGLSFLSSDGGGGSVFGGGTPQQSSGFDFGGLFEAGLAVLPGVLQAFGVGQPASHPGGAPIGVPVSHVSTSGPGILQRGAEALGFGIPGGDLVPTGVGSLQSVACITPRVGTTMRLPSRVDVPTVDSRGNQRFTTFKNMGRPLLWSGDLAAARRVRKVAAKARRRVGGR